MLSRVWPSPAVLTFVRSGPVRSANTAEAVGPERRPLAGLVQDGLGEAARLTTLLVHRAEPDVEWGGLVPLAPVLDCELVVPPNDGSRRHDRPNGPAAVVRWTGRPFGLRGTGRASLA